MHLLYKIMNNLEHNSPELYNWMDKVYNKQFDTHNRINNGQIPEATIEGGYDKVYNQQIPEATVEVRYNRINNRTNNRSIPEATIEDSQHGGRETIKELEEEIKKVVSELEKAVAASEYPKIKNDLIPKLDILKGEIEDECKIQKQKFSEISADSTKSGGADESCCQSEKEKILYNIPTLDDCNQDLFDVSSFNTRLNAIKKKYKYIPNTDLLEMIEELDKKIIYLENQIVTKDKYNTDYKIVNDKLAALFNYSLQCNSCNKQKPLDPTYECLKYPPIINCPPI
jgi:hypothetical protein